MRKIFSYGVASVQGEWPVQEDGYFVHPSKAIYSLADGFGGAGAGDMAAKMALTELRDRSQQEIGLSRLQWQHAFFEDSNKKINKWNEGRNINKKGGCSFLLAQLSVDRVLTLSQCGACAALVLRSGKVAPLLLPQAEPEVLSPVLIPQSALGIGDSLAVEKREIALQLGDYVLLATSGFHWNADSLLVEFLQQLSIRGAAGGDLAPLVGHLAATFGGHGNGLNRSLLVLEIS